MAEHGQDQEDTSGVDSSDQMEVESHIVWLDTPIRELTHTLQSIFIS